MDEERSQRTHQLKAHSEFLRLYVHIRGHHNFIAKRLLVIQLILYTAKGEGLRVQTNQKYHLADHL